MALCRWHLCSYLPIVLPWELLLLALISSPVQFWAGWQFHHRAVFARHQSADMNVLISLGTFSAYLYSLFITILYWTNSNIENHNDYYETATDYYADLGWPVFRNKAKHATQGAIINLFSYNHRQR